MHWQRHRQQVLMRRRITYNNTSASHYPILIYLIQIMRQMEELVVTIATAD